MKVMNGSGSLTASGVAATPRRRAPASPHPHEERRARWLPPSPRRWPRPPAPRVPTWPRSSCAPARRRAPPPGSSAPHRRPRREDPSDTGYRLAAHQPALVEEPLVLAVELLERVVRQHHRARTVGDAQQEPVPATDGPRRWRHDFARRLRLLQYPLLRLVDPVAEGGVDDDDDVVVRLLLRPVGAHRLVQLGEARQRAAFSGEVRTIDDVTLRHLLISQPFLRRAAADARPRRPRIEPSWATGPRRPGRAGQPAPSGEQCGSPWRGSPTRPC